MDYKIQIAIVVIIVMLIIAFWYNREYAMLTEPTFYKSLRADERARLKDSKGMTVNDFALETNLLAKAPISQGVRIM